MTVNTDISTASYTGNASTTVFTVPFYFLVDSDLLVTHKSAATGAITTMALNSDYTVTGSGNEGGGSITTTVAPASGDTIFIQRNVDAVQQTAYPSNSPFPAASHEKALDRLTMLVQQILSKLTFGLFRDPLASTYDVGGNTISNVADAVNAQDVPSLVQTQTLITGATSGLLPSLIATWSDLISTAAGKGAALIGFIANGTGAVARTVLDKLRDSVNVLDFGAVGDGVTDDSAAFQAAINSLPNGGIIRVPQRTFALAHGIFANVGILLVADDLYDVSSNPNGSGLGLPRMKWTGGVSAGAMFNILPATTGNTVWGGGTRGLFWDGNATIANGVIFNNTTRAVFDGAIRNVTFAGLTISSDSGSAGAFSSNNIVENFTFTWGTATACQGAHGILIRGNNSSVSGTQQQVRRANGLVYNGYLVFIQETDNCHMGSINAAVQSGGIGGAVYLHAGGAQYPNFNVFEYVNGPVLQDNGILGTTIKHYISEGGGIFQGTGSSTWDGWLTDYVTGKRFASHVYQLRKKIQVPSGAFIGDSSVTVVKAALTWPVLSMPNATVCNASAVLAPDYDCDVGQITGAEIRLISNGTSGGTASFNFLLSSAADGNKSSYVTPEINQNFTPTVGAQYTEFVSTITFGTPLSTANGDSLLVGLQRNNAGTNTDPIMLLSVRLLWNGVGPNSGGSGTYYIPNW